MGALVCALFVTLMGADITHRQTILIDGHRYQLLLY